MNFYKEPVNILGAGISGLACAIILRKNGYNVNVYEKKALQVQGSVRTGRDWKTGLRKLMSWSR